MYIFVVMSLMHILRGILNTMWATFTNCKVQLHCMFSLFILHASLSISGPAARNWVRYSASILYSSDEYVLNWENSQITTTNKAEFILSWVRFFCSHLYWVYTQPHFFQGYKRFYEMYKIHKMKCIHQGWCLLHNKNMLSDNFLFISVYGKRNKHGISPLPPPPLKKK